MSTNVCTRQEKDKIAELIGDFRFASGFGKTLSRLVRHGIGVHHAGMLPKYRRLVEQLAQAGLLKVICGTDTLGVGINVPIRTVVFTSLSKYDGKKTRLLQVREFHQIAGRAGRAGFDTAGRVVVQAPEHVIDNERSFAKALAKTGGDEAVARRRVVKKKPPEGTISWGKPTFERLVSRRAGAAHLELHRHPRDGAQRHRPPRQRLRGAEAPAARQPRGPGQAAQAHPPRDRDLPRAAGRRRGRAARRAGREGPLRPAHRRPAVRLRAQPAALPVRAGRDRAARPGVRQLRARRALGHRVHPRRPPADPVRPAVPRPRRGRRRDEGRGHRVRGADGAARRASPGPSRSRTSSRPATRSTGAATPGSATTWSPPRPSSATCTSGR